jgi:PTH1 family peptidyl-tRNA hydrolase
MSIKSRFTAFRGGRKRAAPQDPDEPPRSEAPFDGRPVLVVGLGNPGGEYGNTRHNVGARVVNLLAKRHGAALKREGKVDRATITIDGREVGLARPRAFMNVSGPPIAAELRRLHAPPEALLVVYDDLDLPTGRLRLRQTGSAGGNNGMKSLIGALGTRDFSRARIGVDRPYEDGKGVRDPDQIADWVLSAPPPEQRALLDDATARAADAIEAAVRDGLDAAMGRFNAASDPTTDGQ